MIDKLKQIEDKMLLDLLSKPNEWRTLLVDYHPPIVERCWAQLGNYRIFLHFIHKCEVKDALFHPHPWPSAMHVLHGKYEMGLGFGPGLIEPEKMCTVLSENGGLYYDMTHIDGWHYVRPVDGVCATVMLTGKPWEREEIKSDEPLKPLAEDRKLIMLQWFANFYRTKTQGNKVVDNEKITRSSWVKIDERMVNESERKTIEKYFGQKGFVIGKEGGMIDVRFGNDRIQIHSKNLTLLDPKNKTEETDGKDFSKLDPMDKKNWPDDNEE